MDRKLELMEPLMGYPALFRRLRSCNADLFFKVLFGEILFRVFVVLFENFFCLSHLKDGVAGQMWWLDYYITHRAALSCIGTYCDQHTSFDHTFQTMLVVVWGKVIAM